MLPWGRQWTSLPQAAVVSHVDDDIAGVNERRNSPVVILSLTGAQRYRGGFLVSTCIAFFKLRLKMAPANSTFAIVSTRRLLLPVVIGKTR